MQDDLAISHPSLDITLLGVNYVGHESGVTTACSGNDIALLQDTVAEDVVGDWSPTYRDVVIVDQNNEVVGTYNLTANNLAIQANYDALKALLVAAATP